MSRFIAACFLLAAYLAIGSATRATVLTPCDYTPAESRLMSLALQGSLQWLDDAFLSDVADMVTGSLSTDFVRLFESLPFGYRLDGRADLAFSATAFSLELSGGSNFKWYVHDDAFAIGAIDARYAEMGGVGLDVTGGLGYGRFRDVTPLSRAIRIQNTLLDEGLLLAPLTDEILQTMARTIGRVDVALADKMVALEGLLVETGLVQNDDLGARGLFLIEGIATSPMEARLCGWDVQFRLGVAASGFPSPQVSEAVVLSGNYAIVPDPVSQFQTSMRYLSRVTELDRHFLEGSLFYGRRIRETWRIRAGYDFSLDCLWEEESEAPIHDHSLWVSLLGQLSANLSLAIDGELRYQTGDEELTKSLTVHFNYDVF
jgi:hypothetical protein